MNVIRSSCRLLIQVQNSINVTGKRYISRHVRPTYLVISKRKENLKNPPPANPRRSGFLDWNYEAEIYAFNQRLKEKFHTDLLTQALTHYSYVLQEEQKQRNVGIDDPDLSLEDNREMIQKGQVLTSKIVKIYLGQALPRAAEECILALHEYLLSEEVLANSSFLIGTKDIILSEEYPPTKETLANTFLALVAALEESVDEVHATKFVRDFLIATLAEKDLKEIWCPENPMDILNNILVRDGREPAEPRLIGQSGVTSLVPIYNVGLYSQREFISSGMENNVDDAVKIAALNALYQMFDFADSSKPIKTNFVVNPSTDVIKNLPLHDWCRKKVDQLIQSN